MRSRAVAQVHPLTLPPDVEDIVTRGLERFAKSAAYELLALYHGESIWYVKRVEDSVVKRIQVAAFGSPASPELRFIPDISEIDATKGVIRMAASTPPELIHTLLLRSLVADAGAEDPEARIERTAWETLKSLDVHSYPKLTRSIPLRKL